MATYNKKTIEDVEVSGKTGYMSSLWLSSHKPSGSSGVTGIGAAVVNKKKATLVLDFSGVPFMDSSGLGLIIGRADRAAAIGASVRVVGLLPSLRRLVSLSGLGKLANLTVAD